MGTTSRHLRNRFRAGKIALVFSAIFSTALLLPGCGAPAANPAPTSPTGSQSYYPQGSYPQGGYPMTGGYYGGGYPPGYGQYGYSNPPNLFAGGTTTNSSMTSTVPSVPQSSYSQYTYAGGIETIFQQYCSQCHAIGGSPQTLISEGIVIPGNPTGSPLYQAVASGQMPQGGTPLPSADIQAIGLWITNGAQ